jgi:hypothetical protein
MKSFSVIGGTSLALTGARGIVAPPAHIYEEQHDMEMETLRDLYVEELKGLYRAENRILRALPLMTNAATHRG